MGSRERRERERAELRSRILAAARELFVMEGYEATTMRRIAGRIEYSAMALYRHFPNKRALLQALCVEDFAALRRALDACTAEPDPIERLRRMGRAYVRFARELPMQYRLLFMTPLPRHDIPEALAQTDPGRDTYGLLQATVHEALEADRFRDDLGDSELLAQVLWGGLHGVVAQEIALRDDPVIPWRPFEERAEMVLDALLRGLLRAEDGMAVAAVAGAGGQSGSKP